jgi:hypothetical protein
MVLGSKNICEDIEKHLKLAHLRYNQESFVNVAAEQQI